LEVAMVEMGLWSSMDLLHPNCSRPDASMISEILSFMIFSFKQ
jgi:hypothetical protein